MGKDVKEQCCENCKYYWQNNDTGEQCNGQDKICNEFIEEEE